MDFDHLDPGFRLYAGAGSVRHLVRELDRVGSRRAVVFCGQTLARDPRGLDRLKGILGERFAGAYAEVASHSPMPSIQAAVDALRDLKADAVIALGGGSPIVTARAASILAAENKDIHELHSRFVPGQRPMSPKLLAPKIPQFAVPTTPTTAYAKAGTAVLDPSIKRRLTMYDPKTRTQAVFLDEALAMSAPSVLFMDAALNTFSMAIQGLEAPSCNPIARGQLLQALRLLRDNLPLLHGGGDSPDVRINLMVAALLAGRGTDYAVIGLSSALGHCLAARQHIPNGASNAVLLPHTVRFNGSVTGERLDPLREIFSGPPFANPGDLIMSFLDYLPISRRLRDLGVSKKELSIIADDVKADWFFYTNPLNVKSDKDLINILYRAY